MRPPDGVRATSSAVPAAPAVPAEHRWRGRVVHVLTQPGGGPADHVSAVATAMARQRIEVHVVGPESPRSETVRAAGASWHTVAVTSKRDAAGAVALARVVRGLRPDVVHLHDRRAAWVGRLAAPALQAGVVHTVHGVADGLSDLVAGNALVGPRRRRDELYYVAGERWATRWSARWTRTRVVTPSRAVADFLVHRVGVDPDLLDVVPNGVEVPPVGPVGPVGPARAPALVWAGRLVTAKRPGALLDAVERVSGLGPVVIAGEGPERDLLLRRVAATGWRGPGGVEVVGQLPDLAPALAAADVYVSTSAAENQPLAMLQAMAHGLPVVATAVGGVPEVVRDGVEGLLVPVDDPDALGAALRRLRDDPRLRRRLGTAARERVAAGWTRSHCVAGLLRTYGRVTA